MMLEGKICFITGSTRGIGWATAQTFAKHGATVILNGRSDQALLDQRMEELRASAPDSWGILADASDPNAVQHSYSSIFSKYKRLDVLVNNAGILQDALVGMLPVEMIRATLNVNTLGPILHLQQAARLMGRKKSGSIINMTSIIGRVGREGQTVYASSKAALIGLTLAAAKELALSNIRVNAIAPGLIETDMTRQLPSGKFDELSKSIRLGRVGQPQDVANAALFLASDLASYVTGQVLGVDGGLLV